MKIVCYHIDAFSDHIFGGNPAMVYLLDHWLEDQKLQAIAAENFLPASVFLVKENNKYYTRWFAPEYEIDLCGHGTLALGYVIFNELEPQAKIVEVNSSAGLLTLTREKNFITLALPAKIFESGDISDLLVQGLGAAPSQVFRYKNERCVALFENENQIRALQPNMEILKQLDFRGITVTAKGDQVDFVSRVFYPRKAASEDAVTGSSHCLLVPYWANQLHKKELTSKQVSARGGDLNCVMADDKVLLSGQATLFMQGVAIIE